MKQDKQEESQAYIYRDQKTKSKVGRHLSDINDVITEDDIKNAFTDFSYDTLSRNLALKSNQNN